MITTGFRETNEGKPLPTMMMVALSFTVLLKKRKRVPDLKVIPNTNMDYMVFGQE